MTDPVRVCGTGGWAGPLPGDPSAPSGLSAVGKYGWIELSWNLPGINPHAVSSTTIYRSSGSSFPLSQALVTVGGNSYVDPHDDDDLGVYYYWVRSVSINGTPGELVGPVSAAALPSIDKVLTGLSNKIDSGFLATSLRAEIDRIALLDTNLASEALTRLNENQALTAALALVHTDVAAARTLILNETTTRQQGQDALITSLNALATGVGDNAAAIVTEQNARTTAVSALAQQVTSMQSTVASNTAAITAEQVARSSALESLAQDITELVAAAGGAQESSAALLQEATVRAAADSSLSQQITTLESQTTSNIAAAVQTLQQAQTTATSAQADINTTVQASIGAKGKVIYGSTAPIVADRLTQNLWIDTTGGANTPKRWNGSAWVAMTDKVATDAATASTTNAAAITNETTARVAADNALSTQITTAQSTLNGNIAAAQTTLQTNINTVNGKVTSIGALYSAKVNVNGLIGGFGVYNDGTSVEAGFDVNTFWIGSSSSNKRKPFMVTGGVVYIDSAVISTITAGQIDTRGLTIRAADGTLLFGAGTPLAAANITPSNSWLNANVSIAANGTLSGAGGGKVSITGLGYTGALDATKGAQAGTNLLDSAGTTVGDAQVLNSLVGGVNLVYGLPEESSVPAGTYGLVLFTLKSASSNIHSLQPGEKLTLSAELWCDAAAIGASQESRLYLWTSNAQGAWKHSVTIESLTATPDDRFVTMTLPAAAADMVNVAIGLYHNGGATTATGVVYARKIQVERGSVATLYAPGSNPAATKGAPAGTQVNGVAVEDITAAIVDYNAGNNRNATAVVAPTIASDGTAIDHLLLADGSANIGFEWSWGGTAGDIDGFLIYAYGSGASGAYTFGTAPGNEQVFIVPAEKRAFFMLGASATLYWTFGIAAYRKVDKDINSTGVIKSTIVKSTATGEATGYRPTAAIAFTGDITGTINGTLSTANVNAWSAITGSTKPADNATAGATWGVDIADTPYSQIYNNDDSVALGFNPTFDWPSGTTPTGWSIESGTAPTKETSNVRIGTSSVRYTATGVNQFMQHLVSFSTTPLPVGTFLSGSVDMYLDAVTSGLPGVLVRLYTNSALSTYVDAKVQPPTATLDVWQRVPWVARVAAGQQIYGIRIYVMGAWTGFASGLFTGTVIFDNLRFMLADQSLDNKTITLAADGALSGAGGGAVTIAGLGYTGALNATNNVVTASASAPASPTNGDIWVDTSGTVPITKVRIANSWVQAGNLTTNTSQLVDGAGLGTKADWANVTGAAVVNAAIVAAQTAADTAQDTADAANDALTNLASDNILSPSEKPMVVQDYTVITSEQAGIDAQATAYGVTTEKTTYDTAVTALTTYLNGLTGWNTVPGSNVVIVGSTFRSKFSTVYTARQALLNKIASLAKGLADAAQTAANTGIANAATAKTTADAAVASASAAQTSANAANTALTNLADDNILSPSEKPLVIRDYAVITEERMGIGTQAIAYGISTERTAYGTAIDALTTYLNGLTGWNTLPGSNVTIVGATFRQKFADVYAAKQILLNKISEVAKALADAAQTTANTGVTNAATAQTTANTAVTNAATAQTAANTANNLLVDISNDAKLTPVEKQAVRREWDTVVSEKAGINTQATAMAVSAVTTANTAYNTAFQALGTYLNAGTAYTISTSTPPSWLTDANLGTTTTIVGSTFRSTWKAMFDARQALLNAVATAASQMATWASVGGAGKPEDYATAGAVAGVNLQDSNGNVLTDGLVKNNLVDSSYWAHNTNGWSRYSATGTNVIVTSTNPKGQFSQNWKATAAVGQLSWQGGYVSPRVKTQANRIYRVVIPVRRLSGTAADGSIYLGVCQDATPAVCAVGTTTTDSNPYFFSTTCVSMVADEWYYAVGYLYTSGTNGTLTSAGAGLYRASTGALAGAGTSFSLNSASTSFALRTGLYKSSAFTVAQAIEFAPCFVHVMDGAEPSVRDLMSNSAVLNTAISIGTDGSLSGAGGGQVTIGGLGYSGDLDATKGATWGVDVGGSNLPANNAGKVIDGGNGTATFGQRGRNDLPTEYPVGNHRQFKLMTGIGLTSTGNGFCTLETIKGYSDTTGVAPVQFAYDTTGLTWKRSANTGWTAWNAWVQDLDRTTYIGHLDATNGAPAGTQINGVDVATVTTAVTNYNSGNDRNSAAVVAPTVASDGTAIDHVILTDGSANFSFEWSWGGNAGDIDGFLVYVYGTTATGAYTFGTTVANEQVFVVPAEKRAFFMLGAAANLFWTFGVAAYRRVDKDIAASGLIKSAIVKSTATGESTGYQASTSVAFAGNITGTVAGTAVATVVSGAANGTTALTAVNDAATGLAQRLSKSANDTLSAVVSVNTTTVAGLRVGDLVWNSSGVRQSGKGVAITPAGLVGVNAAGATTFSIDATTGNAIFKGDLTGATGTFSGALSAATGTFSGALSAATGTFAGALSAATGSFSGTLTAAAINAVDTVNIQGNAVTIPTSAYTEGIVRPANGETTVQSVSFTSTGMPVAVFVSTQVDSTYISTSNTAYVRLYRGTSLIWESLDVGSSGGTKLTEVTRVIVDSPAAGAVTYSVKIQRNSGVSVALKKISLLTLETKR